MGQDCDSGYKLSMDSVKPWRIHLMVSGWLWDGYHGRRSDPPTTIQGFKEMTRRIPLQQAIQGLILVLILLLPFVNLHQGSLRPWDETLTGERIREMAENHNYLTPHLYGEPDFNKPPLYYLMSQPLWHLFGPGELPVRFWSVIFAGACAVMAYFCLVTTGLRRSWGLMAALLLLLNPHWQNWTRMGLLDSGMALSIMLGLRMLANPDPGLKRGFWAGVVLGIGSLIKMPLVLLVVPIAGVSSFLLWRRVAWRPLLLAFGVGASFMLVWAGLELAIYGQEWLDFQEYNFYERFNSNIEGHATSVMEYWDMLVEQVRFEFMLLVVALVAAGWTGWRTYRRNLPELLFLLLWVFLMIWTASKRSTYLLPGYPFAAVVTASLLAEVIPDSGRRLALILVSCLALMNFTVHFDYLPDNTPHMKAMGGLIREGIQPEEFVDTTVKYERHVLAFYGHCHPGFLDPGRLEDWIERRKAEPERGGFLVVEKGQAADFEKKLFTGLAMDFRVETVARNGRFATIRLDPVTGRGAAPLLFLAGWMPEEKWGRWALGDVAHVQALGVELPADLFLTAASWQADQAPTVCEIRDGKRVLATLEIRTEPWQWAEYRVEVPGQGTAALNLEFHFPDKVTEKGKKPTRTLPVRSLVVKSR